MAEPNRRGPFRSGVRLDPSQVTDLRGKSTIRLGGRRSPKRTELVGGTVIPVPRPLSPKPSPVGSPVRRGIRNDHAPLGRVRVQKVKSVRFRESLTPRGGRSRGGSFTPTIKANAVPRPGDLRSAAISLSRGQLPAGSLAAQLGRTIRDIMQGGSGPTLTQGAASQTVAATRRSLDELNRQRGRQGIRPFDFPGRRGVLGESRRSVRRLPRVVAK